MLLLDRYARSTTITSNGFFFVFTKAGKGRLSLKDFEIKKKFYL